MNDQDKQIPFESLVLSRLLARGRKGETPAAMRNGLEPLAGGNRSRAELLQDVQDALLRLEERGLVERVSARGSARALTQDGRRETGAFLGLDKVPSRITWSSVRDVHLAARALGIEPSYLKKRGLDGVRAVVLARELDLPWRPSSTLTSVLDGFLARTFELRTRPQHALRPALVARAVGREPSFGAIPPSQPEVDPNRFARDVLDAAVRCESGWFGEDKVFISHVWPVYVERSAGGIRDLDTFKHRLVEAHREGRLTLSGADLVEAMDPGDVSASETRYLNAVFHFVRCRRNG